MSALMRLPSVDPNALTPFNNKVVKVMLFQHAGVGNESSMELEIARVDAALTQENESSLHKKVDVIIFPEYWFPRVNNNTDHAQLGSTFTSPSLAKFSQLCQKHGVYAVLGSGPEVHKGRVYNSSIFMDNTGSILGSYRKRKPLGMEVEPGTETFAADTPFGTVGLMICFDIENQDIFSEMLARHPNILFNPVHILPTQNDLSWKFPDMQLSSWKTAMEMMARNFEAICKENNMTIIRADKPERSSSLVIGTHQTSYSPSIGETHFCAYVDTQEENRFLGNPSLRERTERRDRSGNRYSTRMVQASGAPVYSVGFYDNMLMVTGQQDMVAVWNYHTRKRMHTFSPPHIPLSMQSWRDDRSFVTCGDTSVHIWDINGCKEKQHMTFDSPVWQITRNFSKSALVSVHDNGHVTLTDLQTGKVEQSVPLFSHNSNNSNNNSSNNVTPLRCLALHPSSENLVVCGGEDGSVRVLDMRTFGCVQHTQLHSAVVSSLAVTDIGTVVTASYDGRIGVSNINNSSNNETNFTLSYFGENYQIPLTSVRWVTDSKVLVSSMDSTIRLINYSNTNDNSNYSDHTFYGHGGCVLSMDYDGMRMVSGDLTGTVLVWQFEQDQVPISLKKLVE